APGQEPAADEGDRGRSLRPRRQGRARGGQGAREADRMSRLDETFARLRARGERALLPYFMAGDPSLADTRRLLIEAARRGADVVELGVPFSDPLADGPVIQRAGTRALAGGATVARVLETVAGLRLIARKSRGFIYVVSLTGVTGERQQLPADMATQIAAIRRETAMPVCVGFGISTPAQVATVGRVADGAAVGSAIVRLVEARAGSPSLVEDVGKFIAELKAPLREPLPTSPVRARR